MEVEDEQLLCEDDGHQEEAERAAARGTDAVKVDGGACIDDEREANDGVIVVVEAVRRDGAVRVEW